MAQRVEHHPLEAAFSALLDHGLDGAGEALRILVNEASKIERTWFLNAQPHERTHERTDYANGFKPKTVMTRVGEQTFDVPQVRGGGFYPSALEKGTRTERALNPERFIVGCADPKGPLPPRYRAFSCRDADRHYRDDRGRLLRGVKPFFVCAHELVCKVANTR